MRKFKLLKDIPGVKAGAIFEQSSVLPSYNCIEGETQIIEFELPDDVVESSPEWFEEVSVLARKWSDGDLLSFAAYFVKADETEGARQILMKWLKRELFSGANK